jgi:alpha-L-arabinofuranosidase
VEARSFNGLRLAQALTMSDDDLEAANTREAPDRVTPVVLAGVHVAGGTMNATLRPASWNVVRLAETVQP